MYSPKRRSFQLPCSASPIPAGVSAALCIDSFTMAQAARSSTSRGGTLIETGTTRHKPPGGWSVQYRLRARSVVPDSGTSFTKIPSAFAAASRTACPVPAPHITGRRNTFNPSALPSRNRGDRSLKRPPRSRRKNSPASFVRPIPEARRHPFSSAKANPNLSRPGSMPVRNAPLRASTPIGPSPKATAPDISGSTRLIYYCTASRSFPYCPRTKTPTAGECSDHGMPPFRGGP